MAQNTPAVLKKFQEETVGHVLTQVTNFQKTGELVLPENFSPGNALKSAWLILLETQTRDKKPVLDACTKESICNTLLDMTVQGLSPMKKQCAFVAYGNKLQLQIQYQGNMALAKRFGGLNKVFANVIYKNDIFEYGIDQETGARKVLKHETKLENIDPNNIVGAYATTVLNDGTKDTEIMNMAQIRKAWEQGPMKGNSPAHKNFPDQMCKKTVINRAVKLIISASDDSALGIAKNDPISQGNQIEEAIAEEVKTQANVNTIEIKEEPIAKQEQPKKPVEKVIPVPEVKKEEAKEPEKKLKEIKCVNLDEIRAEFTKDFGITESAMKTDADLHKVAEEMGLKIVKVF